MCAAGGHSLLVLIGHFRGRGRRSNPQTTQASKVWVHDVPPGRARWLERLHPQSRADVASRSVCLVNPASAVMDLQRGALHDFASTYEDWASACAAPARRVRLGHERDQTSSGVTRGLICSRSTS